jgi:CheY-like chemotaxis protein
MGLALVGLSAGQSTTVRIPPEQAYGLRDPSRVRDLDRKRFPPKHALVIGEWIRVLSRRGRRLVRILEVRDNVVVVDGNHRGAGQALELKVKLLTIQDAEAGSAAPASPAGEESSSAGSLLPERSRAIAFDVDRATLDRLRQGFPEWHIQEVHGATAGSLSQDWNPGAADLLVVCARGSVADTLGLCRELRSQAGRALTPLLVLVPPAEEALVRAALEGGATSCLVLPVHAKELVRMVARARQGNHPGRHTLGLDRAQSKDRWRDEGGEG